MGPGQYGQWGQASTWPVGPGQYWPVGPGPPIPPPPVWDNRACLTWLGFGRLAWFALACPPLPQCRCAGVWERSGLSQEQQHGGAKPLQPAEGRLLLLFKTFLICHELRQGRTSQGKPSQATKAKPSQTSSVVPNLRLSKHFWVFAFFF